MISIINAQFRELLKKELKNNNTQLKIAFYEILKRYKNKCLNVYDIETLYSLESYLESDITFEELLKKCRFKFSSHFVDKVLVKEKRKISKALDSLLKEKEEIEYLLSFYKSRTSSFDRFALLEKYFLKYQFSAPEKASIIFCYLNHNIKVYASIKDETERKNTKRKKELYASLMNLQGIDLIKALKALKVNLTDSQIRLIVMYQSLYYQTYNFERIRQLKSTDIPPFYTKEEKEKMYLEARMKYLSSNETVLLEEVCFFLNQKEESYDFYRLANKYYEIKESLLIMVLTKDESQMKQETEKVLKNLELLATYLSQYKNSLTKCKLIRNSN